MAVVYNAERHFSHFRGISLFAALVLLQFSTLPVAMAAQSGLTASYFANESLIGPAPLERIDPTVDFNWAAGPGGSIAGDHFSARWTGALRPVTTESLTLILRTDDGVRVWLDGQQVINAWVARSPADSIYTFSAVAGRRYTIQIEYFERTGGAVAQLLWQSPTIARQVVPTTALEPAAGLTALYYNNEALSGTPALARSDAQVNFDWLAGGPGSPIGVDSFSARWLGSLTAPSAEPLTLITRTDDGVRLWLDNVLVIDSWIARSAADSTYTFTPVAGRSYAVRMEYFERTGGAVAQLLWQSASIARQAIPLVALIPAHPLQLAIPSASTVSPAHVEGGRLPRAVVTASAPGSLAVNPLSDVGFYFNVPLNASAATTVTVISGTYGIAGSITWSPTVVSGESFRTLRLNDALLLRSPAAGTIQIVHECGVVVPATPIAANGNYTYAFTKTGLYQVYIRDAGGVERGHLKVAVISIDLDGPVADQVGYRREKGVGLVGGIPSDVTFTGADPTLLEVSVKEQTTYGVRLYLKALRRGAPQLVARLGGASGPVISSLEIDEYTLETPLSQSLLTFNGRGASEVRIKPFVPALTATLEMFAHSTTFSGGKTKIVATTDTFVRSTDPATGEEIATLPLIFDVLAGESDYCFKSNYDQHSKYGTNTGTIGANGSVVTITLSPDPHRLPYNKAGHKFTAEAKATKPTPFKDIYAVTYPKPLCIGKAVITKGGGFWSGTTVATRDIELSTEKAKGVKQSAVYSGESSVLALYQGKSEICSVDFCICAHPENFRKTASGVAGPILNFQYEWDSDSGDIADLDAVQIYEYVTYNSLPPNPPFTGTVLNPTKLGGGGDRGVIVDTHETIGAVKGTVGTSDAFQNMYFDCLREGSSFEYLLGPFPILRMVDVDASGVWHYTITKDGLTGTAVLP